jgi:DNA-binding NarL/FixJ family response regulator
LVNAVAPEASCVLLADRHHALSEGIRGLLESVFSSVFMVADEASLLEGAGMLRPAVVVVDMSLGPGNAFELLSQIRTRAPGAKVLMLTLHDEPGILRSVIAAGADGVVLKRLIATDLLPAVDKVLAGQRFLPTLVARQPPTGSSRG